MFFRLLLSLLIRLFLHRPRPNPRFMSGEEFSAFLEPDNGTPMPPHWAMNNEFGFGQ